MEKLIDAIKQGVKNAYLENIALKTSNKSFESSVVEYLITVNIAQSLFKWNSDTGYEYSISLEFDIKEFASTCFQTNIKIIDLWETIIVQPSPESKEIDDNGRLDIAIFKDENRSYCAIEVKAINQKYDLILEDVERLARIISKHDSNGIENSVSCCFCVFLKFIGGEKRISHSNRLEKVEKKIILDFQERVKNYESEYSCKITPIPFEIYKCNSSDIKENSQIEDYSEAAIKTGNVFGVIVKITNK
jgi:hypothetical protein